MSDFILYTKDHCPNCDVAKELFHNAKVPVRIIELGKDMAIEHFRSQYPEVRSVPFVTDGVKEYSSIVRLSQCLQGKPQS